MKLPSVSVVVTVRDRTEYLAAAIDSIYDQSYRGPLEVVVVDDGSEVPVKERFEASFPKVRFVRQHNRGLGAARQAGSKAATGDLIGYQDDDDLWRPDKLERQVALLLAHPEVVAAVGDVAFFVGDDPPGPGIYAGSRRYRDAEHRHDASGTARIYARGALADAILLEHPFFAQPLLIRREALERCGGWNESVRLYSECFDFYFRLNSIGEIAYIDDVLVDVRRGHGHMTADYLSAQWHESMNLERWARGMAVGQRRDVSRRLFRRFGRISYQLTRAKRLPRAVGFAVMALWMMCVACLSPPSLHESTGSPSTGSDPTHRAPS